MTRSPGLPIWTLLLLLLFTGPVAAQEADAWVEAYRPDTDRIIDAALADSLVFERVAYVGDTFGHRFSGSESLERAIDWILAALAEDGLDDVHGEPVMVPRWVRGREALTLLEPHQRDLQILGLGGSVGTMAHGLEGEVFVVGSFDELVARADEAAGKIVLFNVPFTSYGATVAYRTQGAIRAARVGAVASLVRSVGPVSLYTPHTGGMRYEDGTPRIPHAAVTVEDAAMMARMQARGQTIRVRLYMEAQTFPDAPSRNVVAEIRGRERPEEVVVIGGHIDSWDVGQGAVDDLGGCFIAWEALRLMKQLGLQPRRTIRVVMWTNEENGLRGANAYAEAHADEVDQHILAIESDSGVFEPQGFGFTGTGAAFEAVRAVGRLLERIGAADIRQGGGGADIGPLMRLGVPGMNLRVDGTKYFWYHHTPADTVDKLDPDHVNRAAAAMAIMAYVIAEREAPLPR